MKDRRCENCKFWERDEDFPTDHICTNDKSVCVLDWTPANDVCVDWEPLFVEYTSENGYSGKMYGESSFSVYGPDGKECTHSGSRNFDTFEELKEIVDEYPEFLEMLSKADFSDDDGEDI